MLANPGGQIGPEHVIGRDAFIEGLWRTLENQSVVLAAERRVGGKTCIITKMHAEPPENTLTIFSDLEKVHTPSEFAGVVFHRVKNHLGRRERTMGRASHLLGRLQGLEIGAGVTIKVPDGMVPNWKELLTHTIQSLVRWHDSLVVFLWDEVPYMLQNIKTRCGEDEAMELLNTLRFLRQTQAGLRMVFTGSIGFHHVIASLRVSGQPSGPLNDTFYRDVPPLDRTEAARLARLLLEGHSLTAEDQEVSATAIAEAADCVPFYIHHVVSKLAHERCDANPDDVERVVESLLTNADDPWNLSHYRERIQEYYSGNEQRFAIALLDALAGDEDAIGFQELFNLLKSREPTEDSQMAHDVLLLLERDHYIARDPAGAYRFRLPLIKRWWQWSKGQ
jgi:hypothetical protein